MRALVLIAIFCAAAHAEPLKILVLDHYGENQLPARYRGVWWALCPGEPVRLVRVNVSSRPVPENLIAPSVRLLATPCDDALAVLRGKGLGDREVPTATPTSIGDGPHRVVEITLGSQRLSMRLKGPSSGPQYFELRGERRQVIPLSDKEADWQPSDWKLLWAGDFDGDGRIDLLTRTVGDGDTVELWLSSRAGKNQLVGKAADTFLGGC